MFFRKYRDSRVPFKTRGDVNPEFRTRIALILVGWVRTPRGQKCTIFGYQIHGSESGTGS